MTEVKLTVDGFQCDRCKHMWIPRGKNYPVICPKCKSPYWNIPKKKK